MFKISKHLNVGISFHDSSDTKDTHSVDKNRVILIDQIKTLLLFQGKNDRLTRLQFTLYVGLRFLYFPSKPQMRMRQHNHR